MERGKSDLYRSIPEKGVLIVGYKLIGVGKELLFKYKKTWSKQQHYKE
ncbi:MAG TPA: hypothetical protein VIM89_14335 [Mucilaginibacter sp.]